MALFLRSCAIAATLALAAPLAPAQTIDTLAGNGVAGFTGDSGPATAAGLNLPQGVAADSAGNTYIADRNNHRVRKVDAAGVITTIAGTGVAGFNGDGIAAASAQLSAPVGLATDSSGNLYIADAGNHRIRRVSGGIITTVAGRAPRDIPATTWPPRARVSLLLSASPGQGPCTSPTRATIESAE